MTPTSHPITLGLASCFGSHMVLQRQTPVRLWGSATPGSTVSISIGDLHEHTLADEQGRWKVQMPTLSTGPSYVLNLNSTDGQSITYDDILVGDVWLCSGQSNMAMSLEASDGTPVDYQSAEDPALRILQMPAQLALTQQTTTDGRWRRTSASDAPQYSSVAFHFARQLRDTLDIPIGIITSSQGHTPVASWMSRQALAKHSKPTNILEPFDAMLRNNPDAWEHFHTYVQAIQEQCARTSRPYNQWLDQARQARQASNPLPPMPTPVYGLGHKQNPTVLFNGMIAPLMPMPLRGVIWYQGETDAIFSRSLQYRYALPTLIEQWREDFQQPDLPFLYIQLAGHDDVQCADPDNQWALLRESQLLSLTVPNTAMAVAIDLGSPDEIHPRRKREIAQRLGCAALAKVYGHGIPFCGPLFKRMQITGSDCILHFDHAEGGLKIVGPDEGAFRVSGENKRFLTAKAFVSGHTLIVRSESVPMPVAVRYAWGGHPACPLYNSHDFPASPFRTDTWPIH